MKNLVLIALTLTFSQQASAAKKTGSTQLTVDTAATKINWHGSKVTGAHEGVVGVKSGSLKLSGNELVGGEVVVDMTSLKSTDMTDAKKAEKLDGHLKSDDFFQVGKYPTAVLKITKVTPVKGITAGSPTHILAGDLTILDKTNKVEFPATLTAGTDRFTGTAELKLDRTKWDIKYGSASFFKSLGDKAIHNEFTLKVSLAAKK